VRVKLIDSIFRQCRVEIQNQARVIDIEKGGTTIDFPVAVTSPTRLAVRVTGTSPTNCGNTLSIDSITVYPSLPSLPILFAEGLNPTSLLISYSVTRDIGYQIVLRDIANGATRTLEDSTHRGFNITENQSFTIPTLQKYRIILTQGIGCETLNRDSLLAINPSSSLQPFSIEFDSLGKENGQLTIIPQNGLPTSLNRSDTLFQDTVAFRCNEERCYKLVVRDGLKVYTSYSICIRNSEGLRQELVLRASRWSKSLYKHTLLFDSSLSVAAFAGSGVGTISTYPPVISLQEPVCTLIGFTDSCGNVGVADSLYCPLILTGLLDKDVRTLTIQPPKGPGLSTVMTYFFKTTTSSGSLLSLRPLESFTVRDQSQFTDQRLVYQVFAVPIDNPTDTSVSNPVELIRNWEVVLPSAFSPNGDGVNDSLKAETRFVKDVSISIFDSWGTAVYRSGLPFAWQGTSPKGKANPGNYLALISGKTQEGETFVQRKWVTLTP
jgi:hypothetical protein